MKLSDLIDLVDKDQIVNLNDLDFKLYIKKLIIQHQDAGALSREELKALSASLFNEMRGLGILEDLLKDDSISEIMINAYDNIFIERYGNTEKCDSSFLNKESYERIIQKIAGQSGREVNLANPILDTRLDDGSRVNIVLEPISKNSPAMTIRKFPKNTISMSDLIEKETLDYKLAAFIERLVKAKYNILIGGGTSSGKTTFLNALTGLISSSERIVTIEDSRELVVLNKPNLVSLECRNSNNSNLGEISIKKLIKSALRMRPDRIIVGEVRADECLDMLQAMNTGHDGSISTAHANSSKDMLSRLETMVLRASDNIPIEAVRRMINSSIEILIQLKRMPDGRRLVVEVSELIEDERANSLINKLYSYDYDKRVLVRVNGMKNTDKLLRIKNE
ncbi:CpaF family protein [Peptoniphilaceae bacterium SGI.131]